MSEINVNLSMLKNESIMFGKIGKELQNYKAEVERVVNQLKNVIHISIPNNLKSVMEDIEEDVAICKQIEKQINAIIL